MDSPEGQEDINPLPPGEMADTTASPADEDGTPLNKDSFDKNISPNDLDVPGASQDDADERIGSEYKENNEYSLGGEDNEEVEREGR